MRPCRRPLPVIAAIFGLAVGCSSSNSPTTNGATPLTVTATPSSVLADGTSTIAIHVDGSTKGPISLVTYRGTFDTGTTTITSPTTPFDATLHTCDASENSACAGTVVVQAVDANMASGAATMVFTAPGGSDAGSGSDGGSTDGGSTDGGSTDGGSATVAYAVTVVASSNRIAANGTATAVITAAVTADGTPVAERTVTFSQAGSSATLSASSKVTDASGLATVVLTSHANGGTATVTVTDSTSSQTSSVAIAMPQVGQVNLLSTQFQVQGVRSSGYRETNLITFQVLDTAGQPYPEGLTVSFSHPSLTGSFLGSSASCTSAAPSICSATATTAASGQASVMLTSGQTAGLVTVSATATGGNLTASGSANNIAVVGAKASGAHITVDCTPKNIPALSDTDCSFSHYLGAGNIVTCTASLADRFNNALGVATLMTLASEAGSAGPPTSTPQYDPTKPPSGQTNLGVATDFVNVTGGNLPANVSPFTGEFSFSYKDACGTLVHNPRDGLVTVIATANGEEGFIDLNSNGQYDPGEPFIDMGEPFIDVNDNGQRDPAEPFVDVNKNGTYNGPDGVWNANTVVWAETRVLYTGLAKTARAGGMDEFSRFFSAGSPPIPTSTPTFSVVGPAGSATSQSFGVVFMDGNFNALAPSASYAIGTAGSGVVSAAFAPAPSTIDDLGISFTQQYCDQPAAAGPTQCANACATAPCYVVTNVGGCDDIPGRTTCSGFSNGNWTSATVAGACKADASETVQTTSTIGKVATTFTVAGSCAACDAGQTLCESTCVDTDSDPKNCGSCGVVCSGTQTCQFGTCQGGGGSTSPIIVTVTASPTRIPADGLATTTITATVTSSGAPAAGRAVTFAQSGSGAALSSASLTTNASGIATAILTADDVGGAATVTVTDTSSSQQSAVTIPIPLLGQVNLLTQQYQVQGVRSSGYQETNQLTFQLLDTEGQAYPGGLAVDFSHQSLGGSYIGPASNCTAAVPSVCTASATTDASGKVTVLLTSGQTAGVVSVTATATAGRVSGVPLQASGIASNIAIVGAKSSGAHITLDCTPKNVAAFSDNDCNYSHYSGPGNIVTCTASLADRFNNALGLSTLVTFASEAGSAGPPATTPQYDATKLPGAQTGLGVTTDFINVTGGKLPVDVPEFDGEIPLVYANACGTLSHNSRDGLVTVMAMANGEEGFVDLNGSGTYTAGEPFIDMGEPYIDANDDGQWNSGEQFVDVDKNGSYNGPNGTWDSNTVIWAETRILYSGIPEVRDDGSGNDLFSRFYSAGSPPAPTASPLPFSVKGSTTGPASQLFGVAFMDGNFNPISPIGTYAIASLGTGVVTSKFTVPPRTTLSPDGTVDDLGMSFTQQYCDKSAPAMPTQCSNVCATSPCYVVTNVGGCDLSTNPRSACSRFGFVTQGQAMVTGACSANLNDTVQATSTLNEITTGLVLSGSCVP